MRFYKTRRLRIVSGASLLLLLAGLPMLLGLTSPARPSPSDAPEIFVAYASGLNSLGVAGVVALIFAIIFCGWVLSGERQTVGRKYLSPTARRHHNMVATARTAAIVFGAAGLIVGSLAGLYAAMLQARPDMHNQLPLPFFTPELAFIGLFGGGALYALGRIGR